MEADYDFRITRSHVQEEVSVSGNIGNDTIVITIVAPAGTVNVPGIASTSLNREEAELLISMLIKAIEFAEVPSDE